MWEARNGPSIANETENMQQDCEQKEPRCRDIGRQPEKTDLFFVIASLLACERLLFSTLEGHPKARKPIGSCTNLGYRVPSPLQWILRSRYYQPLSFRYSSYLCRFKIIKYVPKLVFILYVTLSYNTCLLASL